MPYSRASHMWLAFLALACLIIVRVAAVQQPSGPEQYDPSIKSIAYLPKMSEQVVLDQRPDQPLSEPVQDHENDEQAHDSDDEPMVYETPRDYATWAREERDRLLAAGAAPDSVVLQSEVRNYVPEPEGDAAAAATATDFVQRYVETLNAMIGRGVTILNDQCTADVVPDVFSTAGGTVFDLGPGSGATKGEYREFARWFGDTVEAGNTDGELQVPERWLKFVKPDGPSPDIHS